MKQQKMKQRPFDLPILLIVAITLAAAVVSLMHFSAPGAAARINVLNDVIAGRSIAYTPYPVGYFEIAGLAMRWNPAHGLPLVQAALYGLTVVLSWSILRQLEAPGAVPLIGALVVACYPNLLLTIARFQDTCISCFFMVFFAWLLVRLKRQGLSPGNAALAGVLFGSMLLVRSNAISLTPLVLWTAFYGRPVAAKQLALAGGSLLLAFGILAAVLIPVKGTVAVFDRYYGAYTFANGTHQHALEGILRDYNGEMAMPQSFQELGLPAQGLEVSDSALADEYMSVAWQFIRHHPARYAALEFVKFFNLFRPDFRNSDRTFIPPVVGYSLQAAIAAIFFVWIVLRWRCATLTAVNEGFFIIPLLMLYFAPFVAANTDPRYRFPVDSLLILDSALCVQQLLQIKAGRAKATC
jgi:hypothetical protein